MHDIDLLDMTRLLDGVEADLAQARERVLVETYIFRADRLGRTLGALLAEAAGRGLDVRMLYDPHGSIEAEPWIFSALERAGVGVRPFRRLGAALGRLSLALRNHSRMLVIDQTAYTGGYAWADPWLPAARGGGGWHDLSCRVRGPIVEDFAALFEQRWRESDGAPPADFDTGERQGDVRLISVGPAGASRALQCFFDAFASARRRIWIENAYFFPGRRLLGALAAAAARGVDVRVIVPANSDLPLIARAARAEYPAWLAAGIGIWEYLPAVLHAKAALVDDDWCTVSTINSNPCSLHLTIELALVVRNHGLPAALAAKILHDMASCRRVTAETLAARPRPFGEGALDGLAHTFLVLADRVLEP